MCILFQVVGGPNEHMKMYQCLYIDAKIKPEHVWKFVEEVMKYRGEHDLLNRWAKWEPPIFPVRGKHLIDAGLDSPGQRRMMSRILDKLKTQWKASNFTLTKEQLMAQLSDVMEELKLEKQTRKSKSRSPSPPTPRPKNICV